MFKYFELITLRYRFLSSFYVGTEVCTEIKEVFDQYRTIMEPQSVPTLRNTNQTKRLALKADLKRKLKMFNSKEKMVKQLSVVENSQSEEQFHLSKKRFQDENEVNMN
jgi:hypothetical protein